MIHYQMVCQIHTFALLFQAAWQAAHPSWANGSPALPKINPATAVPPSFLEKVIEHWTASA